MLHDISERASRYAINLNGRVSHISGGKILRGSIATVYQGTLTPGIEVAIKTYDSGPPEDMAKLKGILREVHLWSKLRHENIVPLFGVCTEFKSTISIISEWMPLGNAYSYVQNTENDPRPLLQDVASGLYYLHNYTPGPIVHGCLKGSNVLVSSNCRALLADFSNSILVESTFTLTIDNTDGGSFHWTAPEIIEDCIPSTASDVWAFGMTILELVTREVPFPQCRSSGAVICTLVAGKLPPRPTEELAQSRLTDAWWEICKSCWGRDPSSRPTMKDITEKLKATTSQAGPVVSGESSFVGKSGGRALGCATRSGSTRANEETTANLRRENPEMKPQLESTDELPVFRMSLKHRLKRCMRALWKPFNRRWGLSP